MTNARARTSMIRLWSVVGAVAALLITAGCGSDRSEIRTRCDGPNMVYEAWVDEPGDIGMDFRQIYVVANDPRCGGTPTPTSTPVPTPTPSS